MIKQIEYLCFYWINFVLNSFPGLVWHYWKGWRGKLSSWLQSIWKIFFWQSFQHTKISSESVCQKNNFSGPGCPRYYLVLSSSLDISYIGRKTIENKIHPVKSRIFHFLINFLKKKCQVYTYFGQIYLFFVKNDNILLWSTYSTITYHISMESRGKLALEKVLKIRNRLCYIPKIIFSLSWSEFWRQPWTWFSS